MIEVDMMSKLNTPLKLTRQQRAKAEEDERRMQDMIRERYGSIALSDAHERLCKTCSRTRCTLLPLCLDGSDCPYWGKAWPT